MRLWRALLPLTALAVGCNPSGDYAIYCHDTHNCDAGAPDSGPAPFDAGTDAGSDAGIDAGASEPTAFSIVVPLPSPVAGACSGPVTVQLLDQNGAPIQAPSDLPWTVVASPAGVTISADCASSLGVFPSGASQSSFQFLAANPGAYSLTAMLVDGGLASASVPASVLPAGASQLVFDAIPTLTDGVCSGVLAVHSEDSSGNPLRVNAPLDVTLGGSGVTFYSDNTCTMPTSVVTIPAGNDSASFSLSTCTPSFLQATANGYASASGQLFVNPGAPSSIQLNGGAYQSVPVGSCSRLSVDFTVLDVCGTATSADVLLDGGLSFFSDFSCFSPITDVPVTGSGSFYFEGSTPGDYPISLNAQSAFATVPEMLVDAGAGADGGSGSDGGCNPDGMSCAAGGPSTCCLGACNCPGTGCNGTNNQTCCSPAGGGCTSLADCCFAGPATPGCYNGTCCIPNGGSYCGGSVCCNGICQVEVNNPSGICCLPAGSACSNGDVCCDGGACDNGTCDAGSCLPTGTPINMSQCSQCCSQACTGPKPCADGGVGCTTCG